MADDSHVLSKYISSIMGSILLIVMGAAIVTWSDTDANTNAIKRMEDDHEAATHERYKRSDAERREDIVNDQLLDLQRRLATLEGRNP